jgi:hypothetical protein
MTDPWGLRSGHATVTDLLDSVGFEHALSADASTATFALRSAGNGPPTPFVATSAGAELTLRATVMACRRPEAQQLRYLNELNLWSQGVVAGWNRSREAIEVRGSVPNAPSHAPHPDVIGALASTLQALVPLVAAGAMPSDAERAAIFVDDNPPDGGLTLRAVARAFDAVVPLKEQTDGSYGAFCRYEVGSYVARLSWSRFDGLAFDALGPGDPPFTFNDETLARIMELNAYLQVGGVSLWGDAERARLVFRRAIPLLWLSCARDEGATLLSYDFIKSTLDNASGAWEDIERIWRGGPILRP